MKTLFNTTISFLIIFLLFACKKDDPVTPITPVASGSYLDNPDFIKDGLIAYYPFNGDIKDYSDNVHDAISSNPTFVNDRYNVSSGAVYFDGTDDYILIPSFGEKMINNEGTILLWGKNDTTYPGNDQLKCVIFSNVDSSNASFLLSSWDDEMWYSYGVYPKLGGGLYNAPVTKAEFELFVMSFTKNSIALHNYSTSVQQTTSINLTNDNFFDWNNQDFYLGKSVIDTFDSETFDNYFTYFKGAIDDLVIYNRILTEDEIRLFSNWAENK